MNRPSILRILALVALSLLAIGSYAQKKIYSWVDDNGVRHVSDSVPPESARHDRTVLNEQGVEIGTEQGEITDEERAEMEAKARADEERARALKEQQERDQMLLDTYLDADDIVKLRDRRLELLDAQIKVFEIYLSNLHKRLDGLLKNADRFAPRNESDDAPPMPHNLALDIERTKSSIEMYEKRLKENKANQQEIREEFQRDIDRFRELKGA